MARRASWLLLLLVVPLWAQDAVPEVVPEPPPVSLRVAGVDADSVMLQSVLSESSPVDLPEAISLPRDGSAVAIDVSVRPPAKQKKPFDWFTSLYTFLGGLGIFFFGMKNLSESLQSMAGGLIRKTIKTLTGNRFSALIVGTLVTTLVQSSSVTTVMVVGFVNAGLMTLAQAVGVIFGANIGTTITGWIISIKIGKYGLLLVGLGIFPILFSSRTHWKTIGRLLLALGFVFMGLEFMSAAFKPLKDTATFQQVMVYFTAENYLSLFACVGIGAGLTFIVQSSSAMLGVTIALATTGAIGYQTAVALVLGENIGTTITALLASVGANTDAKRAARAHATFNVIGVCLILPVFWWFLDLVGVAVGGDPEANVAVTIATAHSLFNVTMSIAFLPFLPQLARFVSWITPQKRAKEVPHLKFLGGADIRSPALALSGAESELGNMASIVTHQFQLAGEYLRAKEPDRMMRERISKKEEITDHIQTEITQFLCRAAEAQLSFEESTLAYGLIRAADELESVADYCNSLARYRDRLDQSGEVLPKSASDDLQDLLQRAQEFYAMATAPVASEEIWNLARIKSERAAFKKRSKEVFEAHRARTESGECPPIAGMLYRDLVNGLRKIVSHTLNVVEALSGKTLE